MTTLQEKLSQLKLPTMSQQLDRILSEAAAKELSLAQALEWLTDLELETRNAHAIERRFRLSKLQAQHTIDSFLFTHHTSRMKMKPRLLRLLDLEFLRKGTNLVLIGNPGVGKTLLAKTFGWRACQANVRVFFSTAMDMINHLLASQVDHSLVRKLKIFTDPTLLVVDELGYLSLDQQTSNLFYQVISTRHSQRRSTIITTNTPFSDWGNILFNTTIATAIADRLVENSEIFLLGGESFRKTNKDQPPK
jgi:DNA replication protein DnaC